MTVRRQWRQYLSDVDIGLGVDIRSDVDIHPGVDIYPGVDIHSDVDTHLGVNVHFECGIVWPLNRSAFERRVNENILTLSFIKECICATLMYMQAHIKKFNKLQCSTPTPTGLICFYLCVC